MYYPKKLENIKINNSQQAYELAIQNWNLETIQMQETVKVIFLNRANQALGIYDGDLYFVDAATQGAHPQRAVTIVIDGAHVIVTE